MNNKISIITVVKNGMPYIKSAIKSFELQDYQDKELIIIYSKSNDGTEEFLNKFYPNISYCDQKSLNKFGSINLGLEKASGEIIGLLHADDFFYNENTLKNISNHFDDKVNCIYGDIMFCKKKILAPFQEYGNPLIMKTEFKVGWTPLIHQFL